MTRVRIPETVVRGKRLGRHVNHDPRSWAYRFRGEGLPLVSVRHSTDDDAILDQGEVGSCTGNATTGALICSLGSLNKALTPAQRGTLDETLALRIYSQATKTDGSPGTYPPDDTGSDGLDAAKAAQTYGYVNGYTHAMGLTDALAALQLDPIIIGVNWYTGFDSPDAQGRIVLRGTVRGGHEICLDAYDADEQAVWIRNSWSTGYGLDGRVQLKVADLGTLLARQGDATILNPLSAPAPVPTPDPAADADAALWAANAAWRAAKHTRSNAAAVTAEDTWGAAKGLS